MCNTIKKLALGTIASLFALNANAGLIKIYDSATSINNLTEAQAIIDAASGPDLMMETDHVWFSDVGTAPNLPWDPVGDPWPGNFNTKFVVEVTGLIDTDNYSHIYVGHDDGVRVTVDHDVIYEYTGITDYNYTTNGFYLGSAAGLQPFDLLYFENVGEADLFVWGYRRNNGTKEKLSLYSVPEPATLALFGIGLFGLGVARRRRHTQIQ